MQATHKTGALTTTLALVLPVAFAAAVLVVDLERVHAAKVDMQSTAHAAAQAAAATWQPDAGRPRTTRVRFGAESPRRSDFEIRVPPRAGSEAGDPEFLEVVVRREAPIYFLRVFRSAPMLETRAVATLAQAR